MKRRLAAALLIITLPLGMAACHGSKSRKATPSTPAPAATANANPTQAPSQAPGPTQAPAPTQAPGASGQSVDEACSLVDNQLRSFADSYKDTSDPTQALAAAEATINALNSPQITNPDVKQASSKVASVLSDMVNFSKKYQSNPSAADPKEAEQLTQNLTTSLLSLGKLCPAILK
ncbi:MAG: endo alpha-1,4 polygalactosaminidase [Actinomyces sp.]|nr:endo alpha-1,4 polygalactosaminidase [Actinomyces sp.]